MKKPIHIVSWHHSKEFLRKVVKHTNEIIKSIEEDNHKESENGKTNLERFTGSNI